MSVSVAAVTLVFSVAYQDLRNMQYAEARRTFTVRERPTLRSRALMEVPAGKSLLVKRIPQSGWLAILYRDGGMGYGPAGSIKILRPLPKNEYALLQRSVRANALIDRAIADNQEAMDQLLKMGRPAVEVILDRLAIPTETKDYDFQVAFLLVRFGSVAIGPMLKYWRTGNRYQKQAIVAGLAQGLEFQTYRELHRQPQNPGPNPEVIKIFRTALGDPEMAEHAAIGLGYSGDQASVSDLILATKSKHGGTAVAAFNGLVILLGADQLATVRPIFDDLRDRINRNEIVSDIGHGYGSLLYRATYGDSKLGPILVRDLLKHDEPDVRFAACLAVANLEDKAIALEAVSERLSDEAENVRGAALAAVAFLGKGKVHLEKMLEMARSTAPPDRYWGARALGNTGLASVVSELARMVMDPAVPVRIMVVESLARFKTPEARSAIKSIANDPDADVRRSVRIALQD